VSRLQRPSKLKVEVERQPEVMGKWGVKNWGNMTETDFEWYNFWQLSDGAA